MKYKVLRLVESTNTDIKRMQQDLYARERQALKDLGDPNWEDLIGLKDRLPEEQFDAFMKEEGKIRAIEMIHSILTYAEPENWNIDYVMSNKYMKRYIEELGEDVVSDIVNQEVEEYKNNAIIDKDTYTDSEGVTYNSVRFKNESVMTENSKLEQLYDKLKEIEYDIYIMEKASFEFEGPKREHERYFNNIEKLKAKKEKIKSQIESIEKKTLSEDIDTGKDLENDSVDEVVDDIQDETTTEEEEETNSLDKQLEDLREVLPDLELNLYQVTDKEDPKKVFYFIGKVAKDSDDLLMLIDNNPSEEIDEPSNIDNELPEDEVKEVDDLSDEDTNIEEPEVEDESEEDRFDFMKVPLKYEDFATLNPRYGNEMNPDHEAIMEYLMKCLVEENPEKAEEISGEENIEDNTKVPLDSDIQQELDDKMEYYASKF